MVGARGWGYSGGTLMLSYIRRLRPLLGFKILKLNNFGVFRKVNNFLGKKILWIFFGDIAALFWGHFYIF